MRSDILNEVRLIAIPPTDMTFDELVERCLAVQRGGATSVQLRMKHVPVSLVLATCEALLRDLSIPVYVNDRADIVRLAGAAGAHLGADDLDPRSVRRILPRPLRVGISVGSDDEARAARSSDVDYWSLGPFAWTVTKMDAGPALGVEGFRVLRSLAPRGMPIVAIGGIDAKNVADAFAAGASGVAVVSALFGSDDVELATRRIRAAIDEVLSQF